jgi:prolyl-tRNA editing enzyme YbaK/EbsC (Cys-tRNA(Pro) deacylase)
MVSKKIVVHLGKKQVKFEVVSHRKVYTAYDLAQTLGEKLDSVAKTLLVKVEMPALRKQESGYYVVVVPASYNVDLKKVKAAFKAAKVSIAPEKVMTKLGIKPGSLSPFGSLRKLGVAVDKTLLKTKEAIIGAESFTEHLRMKVKDLVAAEEARLGAFGKKNTLKLQKRAVPKKKPRKGTGPRKAAKRRR